MSEVDNSIQKLSGPPGTFVLFSNSTLLHRGVAPSVGHPPRKCIEITITPLPDSALHQPFPKCGGVNARHPILPYNNFIWIKINN